MTTDPLAGETLVVEYYPSVEDYVHVAIQINSSVNASALTGYAYYVFLILNVVVFPAFLLYSEYVIATVVVFALNLTTVIFLVPRVNSDVLRRYYRQLYGKYENTIVRVELSSEGVSCFADGARYFLPWNHVTEIEETAEAIYLYSDGQGFGIRKNGFAYAEQQKSFLDAARTSQLRGRRELMNDR